MMCYTMNPNVYGIRMGSPLSATRCSKRHQNKVKVKGLGKNSSYLAGFSIFFFHGSIKKFSQLAKKKKKINKIKFFSLA